MRYENITRAVFIKRPNRFIAEVDIEGHRDMERGSDRYLMEVKGCTLEVDGIGYFPDAPTERGVKHLRGLTAAIKDGYRAMLAFVIQMDGVSMVKPNTSTHAEFGAAMDEARAAGVEVLFLKCHVEPDTLVIL